VRALLDTHAVLWWLSKNTALSPMARGFIADTRNVIFVSAASAWEIATKVGIGKLQVASELTSDFSAHMESEGFRLLSISIDHGIRAGFLPGPVRDPFDRMFIAQAQAENLAIISNEATFDTYGVRRVW